jgi:hypothetical protein
MICRACSSAGVLNKEGNTGEAYRQHRRCEGCECQHKIGTGHVLEVRKLPE